MKQRNESESADRSAGRWAPSCIESAKRIAIVTEVLAIAPVQPQANGTIKLRKRLTKKEDAKLDYVLLKLIKRDLVTTEQL